jgi:hypothetical protein
MRVAWHGIMLNMEITAILRTVSTQPYTDGTRFLQPKIEVNILIYQTVCFKVKDSGFRQTRSNGKNRLKINYLIEDFKQEKDWTTKGVRSGRGI